MGDIKTWKSALTASVCLLVLSVLIGFATGKYGATLSVVGTSLWLEVLVGAGLTIPLGFDPWTGAIVVTLANLSPVPILLTSSEALIGKWKWLHKRFMKAGERAAKYERYGMWGLAILTPLVGAYIVAVMGIALRWRLSLVFLSVALGVGVSAVVITTGGQWLWQVL